MKPETSQFVSLVPVDAFHAFRTGQFVGMMMRAGFEVRIKDIDGLHSTQITVVDQDGTEYELVMLPEAK